MISLFNSNAASREPLMIFITLWYHRQLTEENNRGKVSNVHVTQTLLCVLLL